MSCKTSTCNDKLVLCVQDETRAKAVKLRQGPCLANMPAPNKATLRGIIIFYVNDDGGLGVREGRGGKYDRIG